MINTHSGFREGDMTKKSRHVTTHSTESEHTAHEALYSTVTLVLLHTHTRTHTLTHRCTDIHAQRGMVTQSM